MNYLKKIVLLLTIPMLVYSSANAGGWPQSKGGGFAKLDVYMINAGSVFDDDGESVDIPDYSFLSTNLYMEGGITESLTGIIYLPVYVSSESDPIFGSEQITTSGIGDLDIGVRYGLIRRDRWVLSGVLLLGIPTGSAEEDELLWTGDGEFNQLVKAEAGLSITESIYGVAGAGYNFRSEGFSDEFHFDTEIGIGLLDNRVFAALKFFGRLSMDNGDDDVFGGYGMFSNNTGFVSYGPEITYISKKGLGISFNTFGASYGRNLLAAPSFSIGIVYKR